MDLNKLKLIIFAAFFALFLFMMRRIFSNERPGHLPSPGPQPAPEIPDARPASVLTGAELPFPVSVPARKRLGDGTYNRPEILNYYFEKLDLVRGPEDPETFCDQFFVEFSAPDAGHTWTNEYTVATPRGLQRLLETSGEPLTMRGFLVIVPRWNLSEILKAILGHVVDWYEEPSSSTGEGKTPKYL